MFLFLSLKKHIFSEHIKPNKNVCLFAFRIRDRSDSRELVRETHSKSTKGLELHSGSFFRLRKFCKKKNKIEIEPLCNVAMLDSNFAMLKEFKKSSLYNVLTSRHWKTTFWSSLGNVATLASTSRCWSDYAQERRDVDLSDSRECHDVAYVYDLA